MKTEVTRLRIRAYTNILNILTGQIPNLSVDDEDRRLPVYLEAASRGRPGYFGEDRGNHGEDRVTSVKTEVTAVKIGLPR